MASRKSAQPGTRAPDRQSPGLRARLKEQTASAISGVAMELFLTQGFEQTTVDQITDAVDISRRTFFRYFETKEDVVLAGLDERGRAARVSLHARPDDEPPWIALTCAFVSLTELPAYSRDVDLRIGRMLLTTPALRATSLDKQLQWSALLSPDIQRRMGLPPSDIPDPRAQALVATFLTCLHIASETWVREDGRRELSEIFQQIADAVRGAGTST
jgi:AcrR family transcriptional regulator